MIADRIYIPEDVLHAASPLDSSVRLDVLAHIQRDEWLEVEDNQVSFPRADGHGHRPTTLKCPQVVRWFTNESCSGNRLIQTFQVPDQNQVDSLGETRPVGCVWTFFRSCMPATDARPIPCILNGSTLHILSLNSCSLHIPLLQTYDEVYGNIFGVLLVHHQSQQMSLLYHHEEPAISISTQGFKEFGQLIWSSCRIPLVVSYLKNESGLGNLILWHLDFDQEKERASLRNIKNTEIAGVPQIECIEYGPGQYVLIINQMFNGLDRGRVVMWSISNLEVVGAEHVMDPSVKKILPVSVNMELKFLLSIKEDGSLYFCGLDGLEVFGLSLISAQLCENQERVPLLVPSKSAGAEVVADRFLDIMDVSGCNVTVTTTTKTGDREFIRSQISCIPLSSWMRRNLNPALYPVMRDQHDLDWNALSPSSEMDNDSPIGAKAYELLKNTEAHKTLVADMSGESERTTTGLLTQSPLERDLWLNCLDARLAGDIRDKNIDITVFHKGQDQGHRSRVASEISHCLLNLSLVKSSSSEQAMENAMFCAKTVLKCLIENHWLVEDVQKLPFNLSIPVFILLEILSGEPDSKFGTDDGLYLQDRVDLPPVVQACDLEHPSYNIFHDSLLIGEKRDHITALDASHGADSIQPELMAHRFGKDTRVFEAREVLSTAHPIPIYLNDAEDGSEGSLLHQQYLLQVAKRSLALAVGRGAMAFCTWEALPTEALPTPPIDLSGRISERNDAIVTLDLSTDTLAPGRGAISSRTAWPEFHNGVASALRVKPGGQLSRTWIVYNKPSDPSYTHAGFLFGLGLTGQLSCLTVTDIYRYLSHEHDATLLGILLGISSSKRCSMDSTITKMLFLHLPSRHPIGYPDLEISAVVQCAALVGLGQLYQGSSQKSISETLLQEIERIPTQESQNHKQVNDATKSNEAYALSAGFALGLVCLGKGASHEMESKLQYLMTGGTKSGGIARKSTLVKSESVPDGQTAEELINEMITVAGQNARSSSNRSSGAVAEELAAAQGAARTVMEGDLINLNSTSPAAALALGLMYLKSGNKRVADSFYIPETEFGLRMVNPEHLCLRLALKNLILWQDIDPSEDWIQSQIPAILKSTNKNQIRRMNIQSTTQQARCFAISGCCLALSIRFAGSQNEKAKRTIEHHLLEFMRIKSQQSRDRQPDQNQEVIETCLISCAMSLSVVAAGSGDLRVFSICRALINRVPKSANDGGSIYYGSYVGLSVAIGFLFLSGGARTFATSDEAVAYLLMSIFPCLSRTSADNKAYLQAFRHFYVLATRQRITDCIEVRSNAYVNEPLNVDDESESFTVKYIARKLDDPARAHAINRSFEGIPTLEVDKTLERMGLPSYIMGYEHVTSSLQHSGKSLMTDGAVRTCVAIQPRLLGCLIKMLDKTLNAEYRRRAIFDLWRSLVIFQELNCHSETLETCIRSLMSICVRALD